MGNSKNRYYTESLCREWNSLTVGEPMGPSCYALFEANALDRIYPNPPIEWGKEIASTGDCFFVK